MEQDAEVWSRAVCIFSKSLISSMNISPTDTAVVSFSLYAPNGTMQSAGGAYNWAKNMICHMEIHEAQMNGKSPYDYMNAQIE